MPTHTIGIDVGGTKIQAGVINRSGRVIASAYIPHDTRTAQRSLQSMLSAIEPFFDKRNISAIGIGLAGVVDPDTGRLYSGPHLPAGLGHLSVRQRIQKRFRVPVAVDNDANCIGLAEALVGKGKGYRTVLTITIGTGIGAGLVIDKKIFHGGQHAVEFGHIIIDHETALEDLVSGPGLERAYRQLTKRRVNSMEIMKRARAGERAARRATATVAHWLGLGIRNAIYAYSPNIIVLGGGLARESLITRPAIRTARQQLRYAALAKTKIVVSKLGYDAGIIGAALITKH